jgi:hypothetical protein
VTLLLRVPVSTREYHLNTLSVHFEYPLRAHARPSEVRGVSCAAVRRATPTTIAVGITDSPKYVHPHLHLCECVASAPPNSRNTRTIARVR